jgi:hypothetical protein
MILPHRANPRGCDFRERQVPAADAVMLDVAMCRRDRHLSRRAAIIAMVI